MKAIQVKYLGATNTKGSRLKAMAEGVKSITRGYDHSFNDGGALNIAFELCTKYGWASGVGSQELVGGQLPNGDHVFCFKNQ